MAGISSYPPAGTIKSIQAGSIAITGNNLTQTATVTAVNTSSYMLTNLGSSGNPAASAVDTVGRLDLTNATTITATRNSAGGSPGTTTVNYQLTEYN